MDSKQDTSVRINGTDYFYGPFRAIVIDVDDPEGWGRIKVESPKVMQEKELGWGIMLTPCADFDFVPHVGDHCMVMFEGGDTDKPVILGFWWNVEEKGERPRGMGPLDPTIVEDLILHRPVHIKEDKDQEDEHRLEVDEKATFHKDVQIDQNLNVDGNITAGGTIIDADGNTNHHTHPGLGGG